MDESNMPVTFHRGQSYDNNINSTGITTLEKFTAASELSDYNRTLKSYGLTDYEIQLYNDYKRGREYLENGHKNIEKSVLYKTLDEIKDKIEKCAYSSEPSTSRLIDPIDTLKEMEDDLFGHMDVDSLPSVNKCKKIIRRMNRKLSRPLPLPEPNEKKHSKTSNESHIYNEFIKYDNVTAIERSKLKKTSKWDMKEDVQYEKKKTSPAEKRKKHIGCSSQTLYTIKNNKIVRLEKRKGAETNQTSNRIGDYNLIDIKLPINDSEKKLLEGTKLCIDDIKKLPKFQNYDPGQPSKVLFLKNISGNIKQRDLQRIFNDGDECDVRLMTGKMRGQAFLTFESVDVSTRVLNDKNGLIVDGRPIIIQYGKRTD